MQGHNTGRVCLIMAAAYIGFGGCSEQIVARTNLLGLNDICTSASTCRQPLRCDTNSETCKPTGEVGQGDACVFSADCVVGLFCSGGVCAQAGTVELNGNCVGVADCVSGLNCAFTGVGGVCSAAGTLDLGEACTVFGECAAGLLCDPSMGRCATSYASPFGAPCADDSACAPELGLFCASDTSTCGGLGPDRTPIPNTDWAGAVCSGRGELQGDFRLLFEIPDDEGASGEFYALPFPNDIRLRAGKVSLKGHPRVPEDVLPTSLFSEYIQEIESTQTGFGPNQSVFMRFSGPPALCAADCTEDCAEGCLGGSAQRIFVVDLTRDAGEFLAQPFTPISYSWRLSSGRQTYMCWNWLAVKPLATSPWRASHTYAVFVHTDVRDAANNGLQADADFAAMLQATDPGGTQASAWAAYAPLRAWIDSAPTYPDSTTEVKTADIAGAALFTVRDPVQRMADVAQAVVDGSVPTFANVALCATGSCAQVTDFVEMQGEVILRNFQKGTMPFESEGGAIDIQATQGSTVSARFSVTVPKGTPPSLGWPVVLYAHEAGGSYRSHVERGLSALLSVTDTGFAVVGIDQVAHGLRRGDSQKSATWLFDNRQNPAAARGNALQGASDQLQLSRPGSIAALSAAMNAVDPTLGALSAGTVLFLGHGEGGAMGAIAMGYASNVKSVVLSGTGGHFLTRFTKKTSPLNERDRLRVSLLDTAITDAQNHPVLSLMQGYKEEADPLDYAGLMRARNDAMDKNILFFIGVGDTFEPNTGAMAMARRIGVEFIDPDRALVNERTLNDGTLVGDALASLPLVAPNLQGETAVCSVHAPAPDNDGHTVLFTEELAQSRMLEFFRTHVSNAGVPTISE